MTRRAILNACFGLLTFAACRAEDSLQIPEGPWKSFLLGFVSDETAVVALDAGGSVAFDYQRPSTVILFGLQEPLATYGLSVGLVPSAPSGVPLPSAQVTKRIEIADGSPIEWEDTVTTPQSLRAFRYDPGDRITLFTRCSEAQGCVGLLGDCSTPCEIEAPLAPMPPALPEPPAAVNRAVEPPPRTADLACAPGLFQFFQATTCELIEPCPDGDYGVVPTDRNVIFVAAGESLDDAIAGATPGSWIALSKGTHTLGLVLDAELTLAGACPRETSLVVTSSSNLEVIATIATLRSLRFEGVGSAIEVKDEARLELDRVWFDALDTGLEVDNATVTASRVVFSSVETPVHATGTAHLELDDSVVLDAGVPAIYLDGAGVSGELRDLRASGSLRELQGVVTSTRGGSLLVERAEIFADSAFAILMDHGQLTLRDVDLETRNRPCLRMNRGSSGHIERARMKSQDFVALAVNAGATLTAVDLSFRESGDGGSGVVLLVSGIFEGQRISFVDIANRAMAVVAGGVADLTDLWIKNVATSGLSSSGTLTITRGHITNVVHAGIQVSSGATEPIAELTARDLTIEDVLSTSCSSCSSGGIIMGRATGSVNNARFVAVPFGFVLQEARLSLADVDIDAWSLPIALKESTLDAARLRITGEVSEIGVRAVTSSVDLEDFTALYEKPVQPTDTRWAFALAVDSSFRGARMDIQSTYGGGFSDLSSVIEVRDINLSVAQAGLATYGRLVVERARLKTGLESIRTSGGSQATLRQIHSSPFADPGLSALQTFGTEGGKIDLSGFLFTDWRHGLVIDADVGDLKLRDGIIRTETGARFNHEFDPTQIFERVRFECEDLFDTP